MNITTVDVWDTLLRRRCHPDEIKLGVAGYVTLKYHAILLSSFSNRQSLHNRRHASEVEIGSQRVLEGLDDEYELSDVWDKTICIAAPEITEEHRSKVVADICEYEFQLEKDVIYADPEISKVLSQFSGDNDLWFLSDFYMKSDRVAELIGSKHPNLNFRGGVVSCEIGLNKRSGSLFDAFASSYGQGGVRKHIGDNAISDVSIPRQKGIDSHFFENPREERRKNQLLHQFLRRQQGDYYSIWRELTRAANTKRLKQSFSSSQKNFNTGVDQSPMLVLYTVFAIEQAIRQQVDTLYYFTREGEVLARIHQAIAISFPQLKLPQAKILEVSRIATFGPSIKRLDLSELNRLWTMYPNQSMRALLVSLGETPDDYAKHIAVYGIEMDEVIAHPWNDERFRGLIDDQAFRAAVEVGLNQRREKLLGYLAERGITHETRNVCIVDIGWRGTIQDNLARVLPQTRWHGVYLALFKFLNSQPENVSKSAFLFDCNGGHDTEDDLTPQAPLEMLFNSDTGSVTGYEYGLNGFTAKKIVDKEENAVHASFTNDFQKGVVAATPEIFAYFRSRCLLSTDMRLYVRRMIKNLLKEPPRPMARAYFQLSHNETFGNGRFVQQKGSLRPWQTVRKLKPKKVVQFVNQQAAESGWVGGFFRLNHLTGAKRICVAFSDGYNLLKFSRKFALKSAKHGFGSVFGDLLDTLNRPRDIASIKTPGPEIQPLLRVVGDINFSDLDALTFNERHSALRRSDHGQLTMNWIIPDIGIGSGGHMTILRFVKYFRELGFLCRIYVHERSQHGSPENLRAFIEAYYTQIHDIEVYSSIEDVKDCDILIATLWVTAYDIFKRTNTKFKAYFIQDYEPLFYPRGSHGVLAENSYKLNLFGIAASSWLQRIVTSEYGMESCQFNLGYNPDVYYEDKLVSRDLDRIAVYMRPSTERRGTELLLAALAIVKARRPRTNVVIFGTNEIGYSDIPFRAEVMGIQTEEQLRRQHSGSAITLLSSLTNYSLLPIEAAACGAVVVDLDVDSMRATFGQQSPIVLAPPDPVGLATRLISLLDNPTELDHRSCESKRFAHKFTWDAAFADVANGLAQGYFGNKNSARKLPEGALVKAQNGQKIFYVKDSARFHIASAEQFLKAGLRFEDVIEISMFELLSIQDKGPFSDSQLSGHRALNVIPPAVNSLLR
jgi:glycosyltransferase involved in cell wall biosynthesis